MSHVPKTPQDCHIQRGRILEQLADDSCSCPTLSRAHAELLAAHANALERLEQLESGPTITMSRTLLEQVVGELKIHADSVRPACELTAHGLEGLQSLLRPVLSQTQCQSPKPLKTLAGANLPQQERQQKTFTWHAGDDYNDENGLHLWANQGGQRYEIHKEVLRKGREWSWYIIVKTQSGKQIEDSVNYRTLRDAKRAAQNEYFSEE